MEELKIGDDNETITLRFTEKLERGISSEALIKRHFRPGQNDTSQKLTNEEINKINEIICLGNKITKDYEVEENNSGCGYNAEAVISFEPGKDYEITKSEFESLSKVFWLEENFLAMNKKIEFEFADSQKIKMNSNANLSEDSVVKKLLQDNSIEIDTDENGTEMITFEAKKKYYFTVNEIKLLNKEFKIDTAYPYLTSDCIHKNIFDMPLDILQTFINSCGNLNYRQYIFKNEAKGISSDVWSQLVNIKRKYKDDRKKIEKEAKNIDISKSANKINEITDGRLDEIKMKKELSDLNEYFANKSANKINKQIKKDYGFKEIQPGNELIKAFQSALDKELLSAQDIKIILIKIKESLNEAMLKEAINVLIKNILQGKLVHKQLMDAVEVFLSGNSDLGSDNLKTILKEYIKEEGKIKSVLTDLKNLRDYKLKIYEALNKMTESKIQDINLKVNEEIQVAIKEIVDSESCSVSHERVIKLLKEVQIFDISRNFVNTILKKNTTIDDEKSIKMQTSDMDCIIGAVQKYKLDIEDKNPLRNIMRLFFNADQIDKMHVPSIANKVAEVLSEQIYSEILERRPALIFFVDVDFLYRKIILDPNDNIFKKVFLEIGKIRDECVLNCDNTFVFNCYALKSFLINASKCKVSTEIDSDNYFYDFILFAIKNIKKRDDMDGMFVFILALISRSRPEFIYKKIFPEDQDKKSPIKNFLELLFQDSQAESFRAVRDKSQFGKLAEIINGSENKDRFMDYYYECNKPRWWIIANILFTMKYEPKRKNQFCYFFDLFVFKQKTRYGSECNAWLSLFNFADSSFLYGNLDVIERYLKGFKKHTIMFDDNLTTIKKICDYDNYLKYANEPKLDETNYFYALLSYNEQCIEYISSKFLFEHLKDEKMKSYYQYIRDNQTSKVEAMYKYVRGKKKYDVPEQQKKDIFLLIEIFPDAMSKYIDAEFLNEKENEKEKEIDTSEKNIIDDDILIPQSEVKKENQK